MVTVTKSVFVATCVVLVLVSCVLVTSSANAAADPMDRFKGCLSACVMCVELFGKAAYDGRKCLFSCQLTRGRSLDSDCTNEIFHIITQ
jgi:hypothetical protein